MNQLFKKLMYDDVFSEIDDSYTYEKIATNHAICLENGALVTFGLQEQVKLIKAK